MKVEQFCLSWTNMSNYKLQQFCFHLKFTFILYSDGQGCSSWYQGGGGLLLVPGGHLLLPWGLLLLPGGLYLVPEGGVFVTVCMNGLHPTVQLYCTT